MDHFRRINGYTRGEGTNANNNNIQQQYREASPSVMSDHESVYHSASGGSTDDESTSESDIEDEDFHLLGACSTSILAPSAESSTGSRVWDSMCNNTSLETLATTHTETIDGPQQKSVLVPDTPNVFQYQVSSFQDSSAPALPAEQSQAPCAYLGHRKNIPLSPLVQAGNPAQVPQQHGSQRRSTADKRRRHRTSSRRASNRRLALSLVNKVVDIEAKKAILAKACKKPDPSSTLVKALVTAQDLQATSFYQEPILDCVKLATKKHNKCLQMILRTLGPDTKRILDKIQRSEGSLLQLILTRADRGPLTRQNVKLMKILLKSGVDPNETANETGPTPLHQAIGLGVYSAVHLLLNQGADPQIRNSAGLNALELANQWARTKDGTENERQKKDREMILQHLSSIKS